MEAQKFPECRGRLDKQGKDRTGGEEGVTGVTRGITRAEERRPGEAELGERMNGAVPSAQAPNTAWETQRASSRRGLSGLNLAVIPLESQGAVADPLPTLPTLAGPPHVAGT